MTGNQSNSLNQDSEQEITDPKTIAERISADSFDAWYRERQVRENIHNGTAFFNGPDGVPKSTRHSPSALLQCSRKILYRQLNAPEEEPDPRGIFWFGSKFEEEVVLPFFREKITTEGTYACNSLWVDTTISTDIGDIRIKGSTDPAIVDRDGRPILVSEIKSKSSVDHLNEPNKHHKAQAHAYLYGLSEKYDRELTDAVILYGSRDTLSVRSFNIEFDADFWWDTVIRWAANHSEYRLNEELPPADPEYDWECSVCSYKNRCGKGDVPVSDVGPGALIPKYEYPREQTETYLQAHPGAKLTPTLAHLYPGLVDQYGTYDWHCYECGATYAWDELSLNGTGSSNTPFCPECLDEGQRRRVRGPLAEEQHNIEWEGDYE